MSRQELVSAFLEGQISRRTLIRRLIAGGVSTGAAISYAHVLSPERAGAAVGARASDHYPLVDLAITSASLAAIKTPASGPPRVQFRLTSSEEITQALFWLYMRTGNGGIPIGIPNPREETNVMGGAGTRSMAIQINPASLGTRTSVRFYVQMIGRDAEGYQVLASTAKTLT